MKNFFKKIKKIFIKVFTDNKTNNTFLWIVSLILLIVGCTTKIPGLYLWGFLGVCVVNFIIKKVVSAHVMKNNKPIEEIKGGSSADA